MKTKNKLISKLLPVIALTGGVLFSGYAHSDTPFTYTGDNGPSYWGGTCTATSSLRQSPVNIANAVVNNQLTALNLLINPATIHILNNGHTIEQVYEGTGSRIFFSGREYDLLQFHFHTLSEHALASDRGDMEMHAVFSQIGGTDTLVLSTLFDIGFSQNTLIQTLINAGLPEKEGDTTISSLPVNLANGLSNTASYYTYSGSLTTPGCTENVTWIVLKNRSTLTQQQWTSFRDIMGNNFRPLQAINNRTINVTSEGLIEEPFDNLN